MPGLVITGGGISEEELAPEIKQFRKECQIQSEYVEFEEIPNKKDEDEESK